MVIPERVSGGLLAMLRGRGQRVVVVIHCNHAQEIDADVAASLGALHRAGASLLNQSVLLKGVNDDAPAISALSKRLFAENVLPYYLHLPDRVAGTRHFAVTLEAAEAIMRELQACLPGYLVPRLVREDPGEPAKTRIV